MPNLIELSQSLQGMPDQYLAQEAQAPSGVAPPYLVLAELGRRQALRQSATAPPQSTVYDDIVGPMRSIDALTQPQPSRAPVTMGGPPMAPPPMQGPPPVGLGAMPPMMAPSGPPMRMASGGLVHRMYGGGMVPYFDPYKLVGTFEPTYAGYARGGGDLYGGGSILPVAAPAPPPIAPMAVPTRKPLMYGGIPLPEYRTSAPVVYEPLQRPAEVKEPDFATVLNEIKRNREQFGPPTAPYADRIKELEQERRNIRGPSMGNALMNLGLGIMASRSAAPGQAFGEAGLRALAGYQDERERAETKRLSVADRLAGLRQREAEFEANRTNKDFDLAGDLQQKRYSTAMVNAQNAAAFTNREADLRREQVRQAALDDRARAEYDLKVAELAGRPRQTENIDPNSELGILAHGRKVELTEAAEARHRRALAGTGTPKLTQGYVDDNALGEVQNVLRWIPKDVDPEAAFERAKNEAIQNVRNPRYFAGMPDEWRDRTSVAIRSMGYPSLEKTIPGVLGTALDKKQVSSSSTGLGATKQIEAPKAQTANSPNAPVMRAQPPRPNEPVAFDIDLNEDDTRNRSVAPPPPAATVTGVPISQPPVPVTVPERIAARQAQSEAEERERAAQMARLGQQTQALFQAALPKADVRTAPGMYADPKLYPQLPGETDYEWKKRRYALAARR